MSKPRNLAILGSTGSIGRNALSVAKELDDLRVWAISGHQSLSLLDQQALEFRPEMIVAADIGVATGFQFSPEIRGRVQFGSEALIKIAEHPDVDIVIAAIVGKAGLASSLAAARAGKRLALANKESLVVAGDLLTKAARQSGAELIPIDSEHSAIWQASQAGRKNEIRRVILTASGGPFRNRTREQLACVSVDEALSHPNWNMGQKITIDSATLINKALEIIEAKWLFGLMPDQIKVMIHPQSIIHSMVEFCDGSVLAQLSPADMKLPIQYALTYPSRIPGLSERMNWGAAMHWDMTSPNDLQTEALELGYWVCEKGGTSGAVLNAANEVAVAAFLEKKLSFTEIVPSCREILQQHEIIDSPTYQQLLAADDWARREMNKWILA